MLTLSSFSLHASVLFSYLSVITRVHPSIMPVPRTYDLDPKLVD